VGSRVVRLVNLVLAGMLAGNEFGTWAAVHPAVGRLAPAERVRAEQALTRRLGAIMPFWMGTAVASCVAAAFAARGSAGFRRTVLGAACFGAMLLSTRLGNVPINNRVLELSPEEDQREFEELREHWNRLHTLRVALTTGGLVLLAAGALAEGTDEPEGGFGRRRGLVSGGRG